MSYIPTVAELDQNGRNSLIAVSNVDGETIVRLWADPITHRLLVDSNATLGATWYNETPTGSINGINTIFTLSQTPAANSLVLTLARQPQILGVDYTITGNTITYTSPPDASLSGEPHNAIYAVSGGVITGTIYSETPSGAIDGSNTTYTTLNDITTIIGIQLNGESIQPEEYTISGNSFTMLTPIPAPFSGDNFTIVYV